MLLPQINGGTNSRQYVQSFGGMNHNKRGNAGELYDVMNMTCDNYPILSTRKKRAVGSLNGVKNVSGMQIINGNIYYIGMKTIETTNPEDPDAEPTYTYEYHLYENNKEVSGYTFSAGVKRTAVMGAYIIIFPDKVRYNTLDETFESLVAVWSKPFKIEIVDSLYKKVRSVSAANNSVKFGIALTADELDYIIDTNPSKYTDEKDALIREINALSDKWNLKSFGEKAKTFYVYCFDVDNCDFYTNTLDDEFHIGGVDSDTGKYFFYNNFVSAGAVKYIYFMNLRENELCVLREGSSSANEPDYAKDTPYLKISGEGIGEMFDARDIVRIEKGTAQNAESYILSPDDSHVIYKSDIENDCIYIQGITFKNDISVDTAGNIKITRDVPDMDLIVSHQNRLYGCKFNTIKNNKNVALNEIYVSKLGSPGNFSVATGSDDTGYVMSVGENGEFTGAISYNGNVYFFKERCCIVINSYFTSTVLPIPGISKESENSLTICAGYLVYLGANGVYAFNGETSVNISEAFGDTSYRFATFGASLGNKYYMCAVENEKYEAERLNAAEEAKRMREQKVSEELEKQGLTPTSPLYNLVKRIYDLLFKVAFIIESNIKVLNDSKAGVMLVYDFNKATWMKEEQPSLISTGVSDGRHIYYCDCDNGVYRISDNDTFSTTQGFNFKEESNFAWYAESEELGYSYPDAKYVTRINLRVRVPVGSEMRISMEYDSDGREVNLYRLCGLGHRSANLSIIPHRCDHFKIRVSGQGECDIISAAIVLNQGSDR